MRNSLIETVNGILKEHFDYVPLNISINVADKLLEIYERLQKENERLYEIKLDLENQLIEKGWTEYLGADEIEKETATTILTKLQPYIGGWVLFKELEKQFGVEIKEDEI